jgi:hypothetical protein
MSLTKYGCAPFSSPITWFVNRESLFWKFWTLILKLKGKRRLRLACCKSNWNFVSIDW